MFHINFYIYSVSLTSARVKIENEIDLGFIRLWSTGWR